MWRLTAALALAGSLAGDVGAESVGSALAEETSFNVVSAILSFIGLIAAGGLMWWSYVSWTMLREETGSPFLFIRNLRRFLLYSWSPLLLTLSDRPAALRELPVTKLGVARRQLTFVFKLRSVLEAAMIEPQWLDIATVVSPMSDRFFAHLSSSDAKERSRATKRCRLLVERMGVRLEKQYGNEPMWNLALGSTFPLNIEHICLFLPSPKLSAVDVMNRLRSQITNDQPALIIGTHELRHSELHRRTVEDFESLWVAPSLLQLTSLLLAREPIAELAKVFASQVPLGEISPYRTGGGVRRESVFFGRSRYISSILHRESVNYLIVGGRAIGKSSLLHAIARRTINDAAIRCDYVSLNPHCDERDFCIHMARAVGLPETTGPEEMLAYLARDLGQARRLFLIDEADGFARTQRASGYDLLGRLRGLSEEGRCQFIFAGSWDLYAAAVLDYRSPLRNFGEVLEIGELEGIACRDLAIKPMAAMGLSYGAPEIVERLIGDTGRRANLIAIACKEILQRLGPRELTISANVVNEALSSPPIHSALAGWENLGGDDERTHLDRLLVYATVERGVFSTAEAAEILAGHGCKVSLEQLKRSIERLKLAYIVGRERIAGREEPQYVYQVPLFQRHLWEQSPSALLASELEA